MANALFVQGLDVIVPVVMRALDGKKDGSFRSLHLAGIQQEMGNAPGFTPLEAAGADGELQLFGSVSLVHWGSGDCYVVILLYCYIVMRIQS